MADYIVKDTELTSVANAIRTAGGTSSLLNFPNGFVSAVGNISGGGGGGSSDFSTATLSIVDEGGFSVNLKLATLNERRGFSLGGYPVWNATDDLPVILYKGTAVLELENLDSANISISGAIEDVGGNAYAITGNCTITIS